MTSLVTRPGGIRHAFETSDHERFDEWLAAQQRTTSVTLTAGSGPPLIPSSTLAPDADWQKPVDAERGLFLTALNAWRAANGATVLERAPLALDARLQASSDYAAAACATYEFLSHDFPALPDGKPAVGWAERVYSFYPSSAGIAENFAYGDYSGTATHDPAGNLVSVDYIALVAGVLKAFGSDAGHRANLLSVGPGCGLSIVWSKPAVAGDGSVIPSLPFFAQDYGTAPVSPIGPTPTPPPGPTPPPVPPPAPDPTQIRVNSQWRQKTTGHTGFVRIVTSNQVTWQYGSHTPLHRTPAQFRRQFTHING